jgi:membrane protease subunit HflC
MRRFWPLLLLLLAVVLWRSAVFVDETEFVIITQFYRPVRTHTEPGFHLKWPYQSATCFDRRIQIYDPRPSEFLAKEKKNVDLDVFVCWRVAEAQQFLEKVGTFAGAEARIHDLVWSELASEVGSNLRESLISTDPTVHKLDELVSSVTGRCAGRAAEEYGINILDVRIKRISLPAQARESVFDQMRTERARIARQYRAEGEAEAIKIRADANKVRKAILAKAYRTAENTRADGEAKAIGIYAQAHKTDPDFYELRRTLEAYRKILDEKTTLLLSADSALLKYLTAPPKKD